MFDNNNTDDSSQPLIDSASKFPRWIASHCS